MTSLTFYGGVGQIGGNKILLKDKSTKVFLDFGMNFENYSKYYTEFMPIRKCSCIPDLIELGLLPDLKGVYRKDYCKHMGLDYKTPNSINAVLITHAHIDHLGFVSFLRKDIPVYVSEETRAVMELFDNTGRGTYDEYCEFKPSFEFIPKKRGDGLKRRTSRDGLEERLVNTFTYEKSFKIGSLTITPYRVDHSLPGATGFIIGTSEGNLVYTGDLRFHGRHTSWSNNFVEQAAKAEPVCMITEGTRIDKNSARTEEHVQRASTKLIKDKKGVVVANFPIRDTDRLLTFYKTAVENNRELVIETRQAMLLDLLRLHGVTELPKSTDEHIRIYTPRKGWGLINSNMKEKHKLRDYQTWEKEYVQKSNTITSEEINKNQSKYVMFMNYFQLNNLIDIKPNKNSVHIRSICEPFNDDMELDEKRVNNWLKKYNLWPGHQIHASGHAPKKDLNKMVKTIKPKKLIPVHTEHPDYYKQVHKNVLIVEEGKEYKI